MILVCTAGYLDVVDKKMDSSYPVVFNCQKILFAGENNEKNVLVLECCMSQLLYSVLIMDWMISSR